MSIDAPGPVEVRPDRENAADPSHEGALEALALLAAGELAAFARLADDASAAPELRSRIVLSRMAAGELANLDRLEQHAAELGAESQAFDARVAGFRDLLSDFDARTVPRDWWERLIKTYIGFGLVLDLQREIAAGLGKPTSAVVAEGLADSGYENFVVAVLGPVTQAEQQLSARLALWGRRVVGEALGLASSLAASRPLLAALARTGAARRVDAEAGARDGGGAGAAARTEEAPEAVSAVSADDVTAMLGRLSAGHARRMGRLGLTA